jgi:hypothetical protein
VRIDRASVRFYACAELVKMHALDGPERLSHRQSRLHAPQRRQARRTRSRARPESPPSR